MSYLVGMVTQSPCLSGPLLRGRNRRTQSIRRVTLPLFRSYAALHLRDLQQSRATGRPYRWTRKNVEFGDLLHKYLPRERNGPNLAQWAEGEYRMFQLQF